MPRRRLRPYRAGETARLRPVGDSTAVTVTSPTGAVSVITASGGYADVRLTRAGTWQYEWAPDDVGTLEVERAAPTPDPPAGVVEPA